MTNVRKDDGRTERFDRGKIARSIVAAGFDEATAKEVAAAVPERNGIRTSEIRDIVLAELAKRDAELADVYDDTRRLAARRAIDGAPGVVGLTDEAMRELEVQEGDEIELLVGGESRHLRAVTARTNLRGVHIAAEDIRALGAREGQRVAVRKRD